jgi:GH43 family beta-xylosidase
MILNPLISGPAADPWMIFHEGSYYFCESRDNLTIHVRKSEMIRDIGNDNGVMVWTPPATGPNSKNVWAPELHLIDGKWFIYYAADDGHNENHRMWVLESETSDPQGKYICRGMLDTNGWAIDGTILELEDRTFFIWSGWPGKVDGQQNIYISSMKNPYTLSGSRVKIAEPDQTWERVEMSICEGPQVLKREGRIFIVYSASASWTEDYCLGMLELKGTTVLNQNSWEKVGQVFSKTERVWGVGHCSFVKSPCGTEDWIVYHAKSEKKHGWLDRRVHAQRFNWRQDGTPDFGMPLGSNLSIELAA